MSLNVADLRVFVIQPVLRTLNMYSPAAENLLLGTAAQESNLTFLSQHPTGPALSIYQIEQATHDDAWNNFLKSRPSLANAIKSFIAPGLDTFRQIAGNLYYATAICRVIYYRCPDPLPAADDVPGLAACYKANYNGPGKATAQEFMANYRRYISPTS